MIDGTHAHAEITKVTEQRIEQISTNQADLFAKFKKPAACHAPNAKIYEPPV